MKLLTLEEEGHVVVAVAEGAHAGRRLLPRRVQVVHHHLYAPHAATSVDAVSADGTQFPARLVSQWLVRPRPHFDCIRNNRTIHVGFRLSVTTFMHHTTATPTEAVSLSGLPSFLCQTRRQRRLVRW
jgi:hypothetical protein